MVFDGSRHPFFTAWHDPSSGCLSWVLTERLAPVQQVCYFVTPATSRDDRILWFTTAHPPNPTKTLAAVSLDPDDPWIVSFPNAAVTTAEPLVAADGGHAWFGCGGAVWEQPLAGSCRLVHRLPSDWTKPPGSHKLASRPVHRLASHLTMTADGQWLVLDMRLGSRWLLALANPVTGETRSLRTFAANYDHAQAHPSDPDLILLAQDWTPVPDIPEVVPFHTRSWCYRISSGALWPINADQPCNPPDAAAHEWWQADGRAAWVHYQRGVFVHDLASGHTEHVWHEPLCHAHSAPDGSFYVADQTPYRWEDEPCQVLAYRPADGARSTLCSGMPAPAPGRSPWHIDPHPSVSAGGSLVTWTSTVLGGVDVGLTPVRELFGSG